MIYLTCPPNEKRLPLYVKRGLGVMATPRSGSSARFLEACPAWGADNGCFTQGDAFDLDAYLEFLRRWSDFQSRCLFATAPDVVGDAGATWERSKWVLPVLRELGYPAALVGQDGLEHLPIPWREFDCFFIGGTTEWKLSEGAARLAIEAKGRGKWVHMGRVNSLKRLRYARTLGCDSADGTCVRFNPERNSAQMAGWLATVKAQGCLDRECGACEEREKALEVG